jgi:hypothetical protein
MLEMDGHWLDDSRNGWSWLNKHKKQGDFLTLSRSTSTSSERNSETATPTKETRGSHEQHQDQDRSVLHESN